VIEVDSQWNVRWTYTSVRGPRYLSLGAEGRVLVADSGNHRILVLGSMQENSVLIDTHSQAELWWPMRLCYNRPTSQLCVVHEAESSSGYFVSVFKLRSSVPNTSVLSLPSHLVEYVYDGDLKNWTASEESNEGDGRTVYWLSQLILLTVVMFYTYE